MSVTNSDLNLLLDTAEDSPTLKGGSIYDNCVSVDKAESTPAPSPASAPSKPSNLTMTARPIDDFLTSENTYKRYESSYTPSTPSTKPIKVKGGMMDDKTGYFVLCAVCIIAIIATIALIVNYLYKRGYIDQFAYFCKNKLSNTREASNRRKLLIANARLNFPRGRQSHGPIPYMNNRVYRPQQYITQPAAYDPYLQTCDVKTSDFL